MLLPFRGRRGLVLSAPLTQADLCRSLFAGTARGSWLSARNADVLFESANAYVPAVANGTVGAIIDISKARVLGASNINLDPGFDTPGEWITGTGWAITGGKAVATASSANLRSSSNLVFSAGLTYQISIDITRTAGSTNLALDASANNTLAISSSGSITKYMIASVTVLGYAGIGTGFTGTLDNLVVRTVAGYSAWQPTDASRPTYKVGPRRIDFASGTKSLVVNYATALGSDCTIAYAVPGVGATILTGQTVGTTLTISTDFVEYVAINRALTSAETKQLLRYLTSAALVG